MKLYLKGSRCYSKKCAIERRNRPPGMHGGGMQKKTTEYAQQLREKQKMKRTYRVLERPFRNYLAQAARGHGVTGENLLQLLERRLDNVIYRLGFAADHAEARQLVRHGHFSINSARVNIPSYLVRPNDLIVVRERSKKIARLTENMNAVERRGVPQWLELDKDNFRGKMRSMPAREDLKTEIREQLIVELYSK